MAVGNDAGLFFCVKQGARFFYAISIVIFFYTIVIPLFNINAKNLPYRWQVGFKIRVVCEVKIHVMAECIFDFSLHIIIKILDGGFIQECAPMVECVVADVKFQVSVISLIRKAKLVFVYLVKKKVVKLCADVVPWRH